MIKDYKINLNGVTIPNILSVTVRTDTPHSPEGIHREATAAVTITVTRDASNLAVVDAFKMATNVDGRKVMMTSGTLAFHSDDHKEDYEFGIKMGYISHWSLVNPPDPKAKTIETFEIRVGDIEYKAGGKGSKFTLKDFR